MNRILTSILTILLCGFLGHAAQKQQISISSITTDNGLSQISVNDLYIDGNGAVWIGTRDGLNRYNGVSVDVFRMEKGNSSSLFCNTVLRLDGNGTDRLYILCTEGISELNLRTMCFRTILQGNNTAMRYCNGALYVGNGSEVLQWDCTKEEVVHRFSVGEDCDITDICISSATMYLGTNGNGIWKTGLDGDGCVNILEKGSMTRLYQDSSGKLWAGSWEDGLFVIDSSGKVSNFRYSPRENSISSNFVRCCCEDNMGNIWIGTFEGLDKMDVQTGHIDSYNTKDGETGGMTHSSVWCIRKDKQGNIWFGTYFGGVDYFNPEYEIYTKYLVSETEGDGLSSPVVGRIVEDKFNNLWIATEGGGVNYLDRKTGKFSWILKREGGLTQNNIKSLYYDQEENILWIGTHLGGINRLDISTGAIKSFQSIPGSAESLPSDIIRDLLPYGDSLIVATQNGLCMFDRKTGRCRQLLKETESDTGVRMIADIHMDSNGNLWVAATGEGLLRYRFDTKQTTRYRHSDETANSLSNNNINSITQDMKGNLWFSTSGSGLDLYMPSSDDFRNFDSKTYGLLSDCIYQTEESPFSGKLLLITNNGFCTFDPTRKQCFNYNKVNGFPLSAVNENALCITSDDEVFLGGPGGMVSFMEGEQDFPHRPYKITLSRLFVNGEEVTPKDGSGILDEALPFQSKIRLGSKESLVSVEFSTPNYIAANKSELKYRLEGFSDEWHSCRGQNSITYSNLSAGKYRLVIGPEDDNISACIPATLDIVILPPWYKTVWAYMALVLLLVTLASIFFRSYNTSMQLKQSLVYEKKRSQDIEALNQTKLRFFTNISHEIRTPLTVISAQAEALMQEQNFIPSNYDKVLSIYKSSSQLKELVSELLEFRKQENGNLQLKVGPHDIVKLATEFHLMFEEYAEGLGIDLRFHSETDCLEVWYDQKQLPKVLRNLLSNALKYTNAGGTVTISIKQHDNNVVLSISDTGCGISEEEKENIFNRFYRVDTAVSSEKDGTGIGLALAKGIVEAHHGSIVVESEPGSGSTFKVSLPLGYSHFSAEQLSEIPSSGNQNETSAQSRNIPEEGQKKTHTVIVIDDNESIRKLLLDIFSPAYQVHAASNGEEGWQLIKQQNPDLVVTDVLMPILSGTDLCRRIKSDIDTCHIPVVLLTAQVTFEQNLEGLLTGADDYIAKPFNTQFLLTRCNNLVNSRAVLQEKFSRFPTTSTTSLATNPLDRKFLDKATSIIEENMENNEFNICLFAQEMAMSRTNLFSKMKAITGQTPNDFIMTMRLKKGAALLREAPEMSIAEISERIGFNSSKYFSRRFFEVYNIRPLNYRKGMTGQA